MRICMKNFKLFKLLLFINKIDTRGMCTFTRFRITAKHGSIIKLTELFKVAGEQANFFIFPQLLQH